MAVVLVLTLSDLEQNKTASTHETASHFHEDEPSSVRTQPAPIEVSPEGRHDHFTGMSSGLNTEPVPQNELDSDRSTATQEPSLSGAAGSALIEADESAISVSEYSDLPTFRNNLPQESDGSDDQPRTESVDESVQHPERSLDDHERIPAESTSAKTPAHDETAKEEPSDAVDGANPDDRVLDSDLPGKKLPNPKAEFGDARLWSSREGTQVRAYVIAILDDSVRLRRVDSDLEFDVPIARLGDADQSHLGRLRAIQIRNECAAETMLRMAHDQVEKSPFQALDTVGRIIDLVPCTRLANQAAEIEREATRQLLNRSDLSPVLIARFGCYFETLSGSDAPRIERVFVELHAKDAQTLQYIEVSHEADSDGLIRDAMDAWDSPVHQYRYAVRLEAPIQVTSNSGLNGTILGWRTAARTALRGFRFRFVIEDVMHELHPILPSDMQGIAERHVEIVRFDDNQRSGSLSGGLRVDIAIRVQDFGQSACRERAKESAAKLSQLLSDSLKRIDALKGATKTCQRCRGSGRSDNYTTIEEGSVVHTDRYGASYRIDQVRYHRCQDCFGAGVALSEQRSAAVVRLKENLESLRESQALWSSVASWMPLPSTDLERVSETCEVSMVRAGMKLLKSDPSPRQIAMVQEVLTRFKENREKLSAEQRAEVSGIIQRYDRVTIRVNPEHRASLLTHMFRRVDGELRDDLDTTSYPYPY